MNAVHLKAKSAALFLGAAALCLALVCAPAPGRAQVSPEDIGAFGVATSPNGRAQYVVGSLYDGASGTTDIWVRKYRGSDGLLLWDRFYGVGNGVNDCARGVAVGPRGNVFIAGWTTVAGESTNILLIKFSPRGVFRWADDYDNVFGGADLGYGVAVDGRGRVWVTGSIPASYGRQMWYGKWSRGGTLLWWDTDENNINGWAEGRGAATGPKGNIYLVGSTYECIDNGNGTCTVGSYTQVLVKKISPRGITRWRKTYDHVEGRDDAGYGIAVGPAGEAYITGEVWGGPDNGRDLLLQKYSSGGVLKWTRIYQGSNDGFDYLLGDVGYGVAVHPRGRSIVVVGTTYVAGEESNIFMRSYNKFGKEGWTTVIDGTSNWADRANAVSYRGGLHVGGTIDNVTDPLYEAWFVQLFRSSGGINWGGGFY